MNQAPEPSANSTDDKGVHEKFQELASIDRQLLDLLGQRIELLRQFSHSGRGPSEACWSNLAEPEFLRGQVDAQGRSLPQPMLDDWPSVIDWYRHTASLSERQADFRVPVAFLGPIYSYSYLAAAKYFGLGADLVPVGTISAAFDEIARGQAKFAVVPIENNTDGRVVDTLGMFAKSPAQICGEVLLPIHHCLLGKRGRAEIVEVHSKPQALSQCRHWLAQHLPDAKLVEVASTAAAAASAATNESIAAIASREAGIHHGCRVIDENIEDNTHNVTRFAIIGSRDCEPTGADKTSLMFQLKHRPGALADVMMAFKDANVNLTWIESFPLPNRPNEYLFFVELDGHQALPAVAEAISNLKNLTERLDVLGSYPKG